MDGSLAACILTLLLMIDCSGRSVGQKGSFVEGWRVPTRAWFSLMASVSSGGSLVRLQLLAALEQQQARVCAPLARDAKGQVDRRRQRPFGSGSRRRVSRASPALLSGRLKVGLGQLRLGLHGLAPAIARFFLLAQRFPHVPEVEQRFGELRLL